MENRVNTHRKLKGRLKKGDIPDLEYEDPNNSTKTIQLNEDEANEIIAIYPFLNYHQNTLGPKDTVKLDQSTLTHEDFEDYLEDFDEDQPDEYDRDVAVKNYPVNKRMA